MADIDKEQQEFWSVAEAWERRGLERRDFLRLLLGGASAATIGGILAACGGAPATTAPTATTARTTTTTTTAAPAGVTRTTAPVPGGATATRAGSPTATRVGSPTATARSGAAPPAPTGPRGGTLTTSQIGTDAKSFHVYQTTDAPSGDYQGYVYGGGSLCEYNQDTLEVVPLAAERFTISEDQRVFTFTLKNNLQWSDGRPITTADYLWTYEQAIKPENKYPYVESQFGEYESVVARDARTLVVTLKQALGPGLERAAFGITPLPKHIWERYPWGDPVANPEINKPTVGSGPWKLQEWRRDVSATFVADDLYHDGRPNIDTFVVRNFGTQALAYQALKAGEIDVSTFQPSDHKEASSLPNVTVYNWFSAAASWSFLGINQRRPALKDKNVRKAIAYATDRQGIVDSLVYGLGKPIYSTYTPASWVYNDNVEKYEFDPRRSAELFRQAGYTLQGRRLVKDGQQLSMKILFNTPNPVREGIATIMQQQLQELGVAVEVQGLEFQAYLALLEKEPYDFDLFILGWRSTVEPDGIKVAYLEENIPDLNTPGYINKEVEQLFDRGLKETNRERRRQIYGEVQRVLADDLPYVFLYVGQNYIGISKRVGGVLTTQRLGLNDSTRWFINR